MRSRLRSFLLTSALSFIPSLASATTISGIYVDGGAGYNEVQDQHVHANSPADGPAAQKFTINHGAGYTGFGAVGYGFGNGLRVEAEGLYNNSEDNYTQNVETKSTPYFTSSKEITGKYDPDGYGRNSVVIAAGLPNGKIVVIQKINNLPEWASPQKISKTIPGDTGLSGANNWSPYNQLGDYPLSGTNPPQGEYSWEGGLVPYTSQETEQHFVDCNDCYYISVLSPDQALALYNGEDVANPQGKIETIQSMITNDNENMDGWTAWDSGIISSGTTSGGVISALQVDGFLPKGYYYLQGFMGPQNEKFVPCKTYNEDVCQPYGNMDSPSYNYNGYILGDVDGHVGQYYYGAPNQQALETPLPICTNGQCSLNITPEWKQTGSISPTNNSNDVQQMPYVYSGIQVARTTTRTPAEVANARRYEVTTFPSMLEPRTVQYHGRDQAYGGFANVLYDFDLERLFGLKSIATPFIGGGAGYLWQRYNRPNTMIAAITGTHGGFSWQGIAGVAFDTGIAGLQVVAQYRMIGQPGSFYNGTFNYGTEGGHAHFDQRFNHQFIVGFRYAFQNQPIHHIQPPAVRPIVAAAPAPVPARSYLVFFDWNQYALTSRARQIVVEAAHASTYVHTTRINVNGYTDSSAAPGPAGQKYNYALSVKRARSVEAELIRNGVPASEIVIRGYGDTNPLVPTAPNTREPQNRRVEIILHA